MDSLPVFGSFEEYHTWRTLQGKLSKQKLDQISTKILSTNGQVHPAILIALMEAMLREYGVVSVTTLKSIVSKARPQDCSPTIRAVEILISFDEVVAAAEILSESVSKDMFHRYLAEAKLYHVEGDRENAVVSARNGLDLDPTDRELYSILVDDDPDGPWLDKLSVQQAYEGKGERVPKDQRYKELYLFYNDWFKGNRDSATDHLVNSKYYSDGDWEFMLASARASMDERDWRSAKMVYQKITGGAPGYVLYESAEAHIAGRDPEEALNLYDELDQTSVRAMKGRIAAYSEMGSQSDMMIAIYDYLDSEYAGTADYSTLIDSLIDAGQMEDAKQLLDRMSHSNKKDPTYLLELSKYHLAKGEVRMAQKYSREAARMAKGEPSAIILAARTRFTAGDIKGAEKECQKVLSIDPDNRDALILKKDILMLNGETKEALELCRKLLDEDPTDIDTMMSLSIAMNKDGDSNGSMMMLRNILQSDFSRDNAVKVVSSMVESGMYRDAMFLCYDLERDLPPDPIIRRLRGNAEFNMGDFSKASASYLAAAELDPHDPIIWHSKGMADEARGDLESAEVSYNRAVLLDLNKSEYWISKAAVQEKLDDPYGAIESLNRAIELDPQSIFPMVRKAIILENAGRYEEAMYFVEMCLATEPQNVDVALTRCRILRESGRTADAIRSARAIHESVRTEDSALEMAACYVAGGQRSDAVKTIEIAINMRESPRLAAALAAIEEGSTELIEESKDMPEAEVEDDPEALASMAESMLALEDYRGALKSIDRAMAIEEDPKYVCIKVTILLDMGDSKAAQDLLTEELKKNPKSGILHEYMGDVKQARSEYRAALQEYEKAMSLGLTIPEIFAKKGDAQQGLGYYDRSIDSYSMAVNRDPENRDLRYTLALKIYNRGYMSRAEEQVREILSRFPEDADTIILLARIKRDSRKDGGVTNAFKQFKSCPDVTEEQVKEMIGVLESAGHDDEARSLMKEDPEPVESIKVKAAAGKVLNRAFVLNMPPDDIDLIESLGYEESVAEDIQFYIQKDAPYGDIVPGSMDFQNMEKESHKVIMDLKYRDLETKPKLDLREVYMKGRYRDVDAAKRVISYINKAMQSDVVRDDSLKMVLDKVQGTSLYEIIRSCKVGVYQARQIQLLLGVQ